MARLLVTRPEPDATALARRLAARGHEPLCAPVMTIVPRDAVRLDLSDVTALLFTSANGVRAFARLDPERALPVFAVGAATAEAARTAGFGDVTVAAGDVVALAALVGERLAPSCGTLLHVAGTAVAGDLAGDLGRRGYRVRREALYEARPVRRLDPAVGAAIERGRIDGVLLFSPRTARIFVSLVEAAGLAERLRHIEAFCLSQTVAEAAEAGRWAAVHVAERPDQDALLALIGTAERSATG